MKKKSYVIIGAGPAGTHAALHLRSKRPKVNIFVICDEVTTFYIREHIVNLINGKETEDHLFEKGLDIFHRHHIELIFGKVIALNPDVNEIFVELKEKYDKKYNIAHLSKEHMKNGAFKEIKFRHEIPNSQNSNSQQSCSQQSYSQQPYSRQPRSQQSYPQNSNPQNSNPQNSNPQNSKPQHPKDVISISYDSLLIASGGKPKELGTSNSSINGVFTLYSLKDAKDVKKAIKNYKPNENIKNPSVKITIIGGGTIALKFIRGMLEGNYNVKINVIEKNHSMLGSVLDDKGSSIIEQYMREKGINIIKQTTAVNLTQENRSITSVELSNGRLIPSDIVLVCIGIKPSVSFLQNETMLGKSGILVDSHLQTQINNIYAAGDVAQVPDPIFEKIPIFHPSWSHAKAHGRIAAANMIGGNKEYLSHIHLQKITFVDLGFISAGCFEPNKHNFPPNDKNRDLKIFQSTDPFLKEITKDETKNIQNSFLQYRKLIYDKEKLVGVLILGKLDSTYPIKRVKKWVKYLLLNQPQIAKHPQRMLRLDFSKFK